LQAKFLNDSIIEKKVALAQVPPIQTGTQVRLDKLNMTAVDESMFIEQLSKLQDIQTVRIQVNPIDKPSFLMNTPYTFVTDTVVIQFFSDGFSVFDEAQGIPIRVL
jgi:hypothetical protein